MDTRLGVLLWNQATDWPAYEASARRVDELGYDHLWAWDHLYAIFGDPLQPIFEGYTTLAAMAKVASRARLGLLVGANTFRNPGLAAKCAVTLDHISGGRAILGIGGAWFGTEHTAFGIDFGSGFGQRLDWLDESATAIRALLAGETVTSAPGDRYHFDHAELHPRPLQQRLPIMIGGGGERKTLRTVARSADMWNTMGPTDVNAHKLEVLKRHCDEIGRDIGEIELTIGCKPLIRDTAAEARRVWEAQMAHNRTPLANVEDDTTFWLGTPDDLARMMIERKRLGFTTFLAELPAPFDDETLERWIGEVKPMVDAA